MSLFRQRFVSFSTHFLTWWFVISTDIAWGRVLMLEVTSGSQSFEKTLCSRMDTSKFLCTHKSQTRHNLNLLELLRHNANTGFLSLFLLLQKRRAARFRRWLRKFYCCTSHEERGGLTVLWLQLAELYKTISAAKESMISLKRSQRCGVWRLELLQIKHCSVLLNSFRATEYLKVSMKWNFPLLFYSKLLKSMILWFVIFEFGLRTSAYEFFLELQGLPIRVNLKVCKTFKPS